MRPDGQGTGSVGISGLLRRRQGLVRSERWPVAAAPPGQAPALAPPWSHGQCPRGHSIVIFGESGPQFKRQLFSLVPYLAGGQAMGSRLQSWGPSGDRLQRGLPAFWPIRGGGYGPRQAWGLVLLQPAAPARGQTHDGRRGRVRAWPRETSTLVDTVRSLQSLAAPS